MKTLVIISTGRCGTKRISEILRTALKESGIEVSHQTGISRLANVSGNVMYYFGSFQSLKKYFFKKQLGENDVERILTDPLISMCIPDEVIRDEKNFILHVERPCDSFAKSMYGLTRKRAFSFIAHTFIPCWQIGIWPLENLLNPFILKRYARTCRKKNAFFEKHYASSSNYRKVEMKEVFSENFLKNLVLEIFGQEIVISETDLKQKSNQST